MRSRARFDCCRFLRDFSSMTSVLSMISTCYSRKNRQQANNGRDLRIVCLDLNSEILTNFGFYV